MGNTLHLSEFQDMMKHLCFDRDSKRGIRGTYSWLVDEIGELGEALVGKDQKAVEKEFADAIAWLASLANLVGTDLEKAAFNKYGGKCPKCQRAPCQCTF